MRDNPVASDFHFPQPILAVWTYAKLDWTTIIDGLYVSGVGMGMVLAVLLLLAVTVWLVAKVDGRVEARRLRREQREVAPAPASNADVATADENLANVAVVAVAIALAEAAERHMVRDESGASGAPAPPTNDWTSQGRNRQWSRQGARSAEVWKR